MPRDITTLPSLLESTIQVAASNATNRAELDSARTIIEKVLDYPLPPDWPYSSWDPEMCTT